MFSQAVAQLGGGYTSTVAADFNNDNLPDLAFAESGLNEVALLYQVPGGGFGPLVTYPVGSSPMGLLHGDFNGDGLQDLAVMERDPGSKSWLRVLLNLGGTFSSGLVFGIGALSPFGHVGDFDGDGKVDVLVDGQPYNDLLVLRGRSLAPTCACQATGMHCSVAGDCCSTHCTNSVCVASSATGTCVTDGDCDTSSSNLCFANRCCAEGAANRLCGSGSDCCSGLCVNSLCL